MRDVKCTSVRYPTRVGIRKKGVKAPDGLVVLGSRLQARGENNGEVDSREVNASHLDLY